MLANHCRTHLLLEKEYFKLKKNPLWGIEAHPIKEDNFLDWYAAIKGSKGTIWDGGVFRVYISFSEEYNLKPPDAFFHTIPFHPNVDMKSGRPCIDFMDDSNQWMPCYDLIYVLLNLQVMLANPVLENPVNIEAAKMMQSSPKQYGQMVLDSVYASKRFNAGLPPFIPAIKTESAIEAQVTRAQIPTETRLPVKSKISFEDYYKTWTSIATSKPDDRTKASENETEDDGFVVDQSRFGVVKEDLEEELRMQLAEHNSIMYGRFGDKKGRDEKKIAELKATKVQLLQHIYFKNQDLSQKSNTHENPLNAIKIETEDPIDDEVDHLVNWTTNLPDQFD